MKIALVTTTINVPTVLELYRAIGSEVEFFIAGDLLSPHEQIQTLCLKLGNAHYLHPDSQEKWKCSKLIGWSCIQRRNIAVLEALKWGAEIIYSLDDDNIPVDRHHFALIEQAFGDFNGPMIGHSGIWFDPGSLQYANGDNAVVQRGFPQNLTSYAPVCSVIGAKVGVVQGITLGDPDTSAIDRISRHPEIHQVSELLRSGIVAHPLAKTVFNTQNTAFRRELAPAMLLCPQFQRYDDIIASLITRTVMAARRQYVHYGRPFTYQTRNEHNLLKDLANEMWGAQHIEEIADLLIRIDHWSVVEMVSEIYARMGRTTWCPECVPALAEKWLEDCEQVLG